jgi:hypothetical protein
MALKVSKFKISKFILIHFSFSPQNTTETDSQNGFKADKVFYLAYDFMGKNNPWFHHKEFYSYDGVKLPRSTPMINNISLIVSSLEILQIMPMSTSVCKHVNS